jgi:hypothetical protein
MGRVIRLEHATGQETQGAETSMATVKLRYLAIFLLVMAHASLLRSVEAQTAHPVSGSSSLRCEGSIDSTCTSCHRELTQSYSLTAHACTSQPATAQSVLGPLGKGRNVLTIADPQTSNDGHGLFFEVSEDGDRFFQRAVRTQGGQTVEQKEPIDEVIGSGVRGQTYLYWRGDRLYELPVSYWREGDRWINSPGFRDGSIEFSRPVTGRCLECHATTIQTKSLSDTDTSFVRATLEHGIGCARCHGPGAAHVAAERKTGVNGGAKGGTSRMLNPSRFSRERQVDLCALCHGGLREQVAPAFSYTSGKALDDFLEESPLIGSASADVHGNQVGLLRRSKCYQQSPTMTCSTCHQVHAPEMEANKYSNRCLSCHKMEACGMFAKIGPPIANDCIRCHMPSQQTNRIVSQTAGETINTKIRTHLIGIYPALNQ